MDSQTLAYVVAGLGTVVAAGTLAKVGRRLQLSRAKHASLAGHPRWAKRIAGQIPFYEFDAASFFSSDGAPGDVAARRRSGFEALARQYKDRFARTIALNASIRGALSDLQFTEAYRVPYQYSRRVREHLGGSPLLQSSSGVELTDVDGNRFYDLAGSYGVNLFGYDFYKRCIERGAARVAELGPVLGAYHPVIAYNARRLREISGLDEVSFHMSGTEAVMQAVRLARYHTGRRKVVPIMAGGAMCNRASATPHPPPTVSRWPTCPRHRSRCCARAATLLACWSIRCRLCIRTHRRPPILLCSTAPAAPALRVPPTPSGSAPCAKSARSTASF
jgi:glutamate-1-semialdehyde 2,1-aminomutase